MRLDKFVSACTGESRTDAKKLIKSGKITLDGEICKKADASTEGKKVCLCGKELIYREFVYLMLNKPKGYVCATEDREHKCVVELLAEEYDTFDLFPAGRLDIDTEGFVLLTNDGSFAHDITSPKKGIQKTYFAILDKAATPDDIKTFKEGMEFKEFTAKDAVLEICQNPKEVIIKISEGKFHQVKRMCERVGKKVVYLKRLAIGDVKLDPTLATGEYRELSEKEIAALCKKNTKR